ncbi:PucR family transcriptional regulator [Bifidobacterium callimiconis]|uniref:Purine catabolism regulatory protein-like family n=1 Tax=Bifidobacterium callimiconis TaxID=2306973 RepID=A0A430FGE5_9BIFI|nr:PucR family transcriptional regulator [Bifidobacterium callimiconis]MBT1176569.1 PucR family transcriptional regulator ligand-binding domain-containing protein [Bifidobacterium callimiconis]RSX51975.1 Purine catabolism regulatory protein-like family [Bifidobacterium callimiconis]
MNVASSKRDQTPDGITLRRLLDEPGLGLRLTCPGEQGALDRPISWVHPAEIADIAMWSEPGEVLLTTGTNFPTESMTADDDHALLVAARKAVGLPARFTDEREAYRQWCDCYISQLVQAGVLAVGFGVGVKHPVTPAALLDAAARAGLPMFDVPLEIPFLAVVKTVSQAIADRHDDTMRQSLLMQRQMLKAAADENSLHGVTMAAARLLGGWSAYVDADGTVNDISNRTFGKQAQDWAMRLASKAAQAHANPGLTTVFGTQNGHSHCACAVRAPSDGASGGVLTGIIVIAAPQDARTDVQLRSLTMIAADVLSVIVPRLQASARRIGRLRTAVLSALADGHSDAMLTMIGELWPSMPRPPLRLICVDGDDAVQRLYERLDAGADPMPGSGAAVFGIYDRRLWLIVGEDDSSTVLGALCTRDDCYCGSATCPSWRSVGECFAPAVQDMHRNRLGGERTLIDLSAHELIRSELATAYAVELLRPLRRLPRQESDALMATIRELLAVSFNVGAAAKALGVHRHTVENRLAKIERLLGLDLGQEASRVRLWIACSYARTET